MRFICVIVTSLTRSVSFCSAAKWNLTGRRGIQCRGRCPHRPSGCGYEFADTHRKIGRLSRGPMRASAPTKAVRLSTKFPICRFAELSRYAYFLILPRSGTSTYILYLLSYISYHITVRFPLSKAHSCQGLRLPIFTPFSHRFLYGFHRADTEKILVIYQKMWYNLG